MRNRALVGPRARAKYGLRAAEGELRHLGVEEAPAHSTLAYVNQGRLPHYAAITEGKRSGIAVARNLDLPAGSMLAFDRGYCAYTWFAKLARQDVHFVTCLKNKAS